MSFHPQQMIRLLMRGAMTPREGAETVLALGIPRAALWPLAGLSAVAFAVVVFVFVQLIPQEQLQMPDGSAGRFDIVPIPFATGILIANIAYGWLVSLLGRQIGGTGRFEEALLLVIYLQFLIVLLFFASLLLLVIGASTFAFLLMIAGALYSIWLNVVFVDVMHGFRSLSKSFFLFIATYTALSIGQMFIVTLLGGRLA